VKSHHHNQGEQTREGIPERCKRVTGLQKDSRGDLGEN
jgi:hypothetical protein